MENKNEKAAKARPKSRRENPVEAYKKEGYREFNGSQDLDSVLRVVKFDLVSLRDDGTENKSSVTEIVYEKRTYDQALNGGRGGVYFKKSFFSLGSDKLADNDFLKALAGVA